MSGTRSSSSAAWNPESVLDPFWDCGPRAQVEKQLLWRFSQQLQTALQTRAYRQRVAPHAQQERPWGREELEALPLLTKHELRALPPDDLLVEPGAAFHMVRTTGGTTGSAVPIFWTRNDWRALVQALLRFCPPLTSSEPGLRVWNGYNQSHISGPCFDDLARALNATPIPRQHGASDRDALAAIERMGATALIITPQSGSGKGGSLEDLLMEDSGFLARLRIRTLFVSSTALRPDLLEEVRQQGVSTIMNFYGSTEAPPAAVSCAHDPTVFHLSQGHVLVEIVDAQGRHVRHGERGSVVVSRIAAATQSGLAAAGGTQLLRYAVGDTALFIDEPCGCGRSSPRIRDVERVAYLEDKLRGGCERWE
ncbi:MAG: hypothetical protein JWN48_3292 [Myxococcaceae bacterium]|nr:hypothetical protein [Myxococcaceae bacterium]